ncbi:MAG: 4-(cytidine 5'-diphospho)-2-C-methyl-D-erythritol kinase [Candidatus Azobacteroides sp.]|nr:4-(cytidine 5'-diphospho)-2-C-methyl-D-erythritol kinase [Candidatus Azobacteroides sp.]
MISFPNAKINLGLSIVAKRPDGYHNIETVFYPICLYDALEIVPATDEKTTLLQTGFAMDGDPQDNLVLKAYRLLKTCYPLPEIAIYLQKNIPFGAGLGGGSADAAFMLKLLNDFFTLNLSVPELEKYAGFLGADCPFFIQNRPVFAEETGNVFTPVTISLKGYYLVLVKPDIHVSTQEAYARVKIQPHKESVYNLIHSPLVRWKKELVNDFEYGVFAQYPEIGAIKKRLYETGAVYASLSGSGSSVFGIFEKIPKIKDEFFGCLTYTLLLE